MDATPKTKRRPVRRFAPGLLAGPLLSLLTLWSSPRMLLWFAGLTALGLAARAPFMWTPPVPGAVEFDPGLALFPIAAIFCGPAAVWAAAAASLAGDWLLGGCSPLSWYRAAGAALFAFAAQRLWDTRWRHADAGVARVPTWGRTIRGLFAMWPGACAAAAAAALGVDLQRLYPFAYVAPILLAVNLGVTAALAPAVYRVIAREWVPRYGTWREALPRTGRSTLTPGGALLAWVGGVGSVAAGFVYSAADTQLAWTQVPCIGAATDPFLAWIVAPGLALMGLGLLWSHFIVDGEKPAAAAAPEKNAEDAGSP